MSPAIFFHWLRETGWATALRESSLAYPVVMSLHLSAIAVFGGMILMTNLRLLELAMRETPVNDVIRQLRPWKWAGFAVVVTCGVLLASSKADQYYLNPFFDAKMSLLALVGVHALVFRRSVYHNPATVAAGKARLAAVLSLALWLGILTMGRLIAYYEPPVPAAHKLSRTLAASVKAPPQM
jgi:hypothetical protein